MNNQIPQSTEFEKSLLGAFFYASSFADQQDMYDRVLMHVADVDFYNPQNKAAFVAIGELLEQTVEVEPQALINQIEKDGVLNAQQATTLVADLQTTTATTSNVEAYAKEIRTTAISRNLIDLMNRTNQAAHDPASVPDDLIAQVRSTLDNIEDTHEASEFKSVKNALSELINEISEASQNNSELKAGAIPTGYPKLDRLIKGLQPNNLIILAARPAVGKTAFALNMAKRAAQSKEIGHKTVVVFNMEMNVSSMMLRMLASESNVPMNKLQTGNDLTTDPTGKDLNTDWTRIHATNNNLSHLRIQLNAASGITMSSLRAQLRTLDTQLKRDDPQGGVGLVIIDYLQLIEPDEGRTDGRQNEISKISRQLKKLTTEMNIPVVALSQLSRGVESRDEKRPKLSDLRDSGAIEQDADIVMFLYRKDYYDANGNREGDEGYDQQATPDDSKVDLIVAKNRQGANETVQLLFRRSVQSYDNFDYHHENN
ncbi:MAG: replicative DNA helicase [Lactobacillaceae bacterium]|jgi:replicative DNA helicase|nr:replicative DNA helicase [Lactobacillaceae bacterium]